MSEANLVEAIDDLLPQTQCTKCGYQGCRPYAEAIARGEAPINQCPPGGGDGISNLAALLARAVLPLNSAHGCEQPRSAAFIREEWCIGCTLCIQACPMDAIVGAPKHMHTVVTQDCTGCELCVAPCPVDCIEMLPLSDLAARGAQSARAEMRVPVAQHARRWRARYAFRQLRLAREKDEREALLAAKAASKLRSLDAIAGEPGIDRKRAAVAAALERARARRRKRGRDDQSEQQQHNGG
jgi:electron transport complex protein RnfB